MTEKRIPKLFSLWVYLGVFVRKSFSRLRVRTIHKALYLILYMKVMICGFLERIIMGRNYISK